MAKALITWGGWEGHEPEKVAGIFAEICRSGGLEPTVTDTLDVFDDAEALLEYDLIVPVWTMSELSREAAANVSEAVARGTGLAGCHGGMCDAFRSNVLWQFMTGANWVAHPGGDGVSYMVEITSDDPLVAGIDNFEVVSEQYYLHVDPANKVLATTRFPTVTWYHSANPPADVPVAWTRGWGEGRVYYNALGHKANVIDHGPAHEMLRRGLLWAAEGKSKASGDISRFQNDGKHF
ncbi:ThuA domain-containing protein [Ponticoccus sp. SC2-23]|uniref:ThuA domain-containing protein n=1 Tax=Alexandriicola marinus TaxID=2081710 RepID=UPI000FD9AF45|nr:ThuA domain-containing protein [Alexandriicola marinus]MBM1219653.1 ThuA domain-containing protein [Ponticoccus sp. SC6-9]MBM1223275.1 ThuA domain-containing protein [Ponticoccus sp. SC6-15]MBM1229466.1 ThuA domain-containing protein [Ponticoccus sp. SC6-38]MBM1232241.1 ThuA domain-containing protein [Ponticoccus sp. SC6-45]MBM1237809.1 ThuA domain-containing protein [Ponticoccus sp. SC6-49]MBM1241252.1 ThuA domain-containing protein [Ponticoccus sp. SC2-64]MBM1245765.1 ThuA domain-contai